MNTPKPRLVFLNRCYWPDTEATGQLLEDLCQHLRDDYEVHVLCGQPNSPAAGADYQVHGVQVRDGITIHRVQHTRFAKRIPAGRIINLISFSRSAANYLQRTPLHADLLVTETDPFLLPIVAAKHAAKSGAKLVSYLQDIYPDVAEAIGKAKDGFLTRQIRARLRAAYSASQRVVVLGSCMQERLTSSPWGIDPSQVEIIPNWADTQAIAPVRHEDNRFRDQLLGEPNAATDRFVVMHSGNMGLTQRLDVLLRAAALPEWPEQAVLALVGDGAAKGELQQLAAKLDQQVSFAMSERVLFFPYQPRNKLAESLSAGDLHVVSMHERITGCLCPSKLYGVLAAGRCVLAVADPQTDLCRSVLADQVGWTCRPGDAREIARAVATACQNRSLCREAGERARALAVGTYDRAVVTRRFREMLHQVHHGTAHANTVNLSTSASV